MTVVPAGVHDAGIRRAVRHIAQLFDRQGVHIGTQQRHRPGPPAAQRGEYSGFADAGANLVERARPQLALDECRGLELLQREFRVSVKVPAIGDEFFHQRAPGAIG